MLEDTNTRLSVKVLLSQNFWSTTLTLSQGIQTFMSTASCQRVVQRYQVEAQVQSEWKAEDTFLINVARVMVIIAEENRAKE